MWPEQLSPDSRALKKLKDYGIIHNIKLDEFVYALRPKDYEDFEPGTFKPKKVKKPVWVIEIKIPKDLMQHIRTGYAEVEGQQIDLQDLDLAYDENLDKEMVKDDEADQQGEENAATPAQ